MDDCRGFRIDTDTAINCFNKDFAIAYDRQICLRDGEYEVHFGSILQSSGSQTQIDFKVNGLLISKCYSNTGSWGHGHGSAIVHLKRGDYVQIHGGYWENTDTGHSEYFIRRLS